MSLETLPKAEVHLHLDGSVPADVVFAESQRQGKTFYLPARDKHGNAIKYAGSREMRHADDLRKFWADWGTYTIPQKFDPVTSLMQNRQTLRQFACEHVKYLKKHNYIYAETRFAPQYHTREGLSMHDVTSCVLQGLHQGSRETGVDIGLIITIGRELDPKVSEGIGHLATHFQGHGVVGLDLACWETPYPPELHYEAFKATFDTPLKRTVHAGEMIGVGRMTAEEGLRNIYTSLELLRADGIGHAIPLHLRKYGLIHDLVALFKDRNVRMEACPVSNIACFNIARFADLHLDELLKAGVAVTLNSDDPVMWRDGHLINVMQEAAKHYGVDFLRAATKNCITHAFRLGSAKKASLLKTIDDSYDAFKP